MRAASHPARPPGSRPRGGSLRLIQLGFLAAFVLSTLLLYLWHGSQSVGVTGADTSKPIQPLAALVGARSDTRDGGGKVDTNTFGFRSIDVTSSTNAVNVVKTSSPGAPIPTSASSASPLTPSEEEAAALIDKLAALPVVPVKKHDVPPFRRVFWAEFSGVMPSRPGDPRFDLSARGYQAAVGGGDTSEGSSFDGKRQTSAADANSGARLERDGLLKDAVRLATRGNVCAGDISARLAQPRLSAENVSWCNWALAPESGGVQVGKSWGNLRQTEDRLRFDSLNCNMVKLGKNPSCDDAWGDKHVRDWLRSRVPLPPELQACTDRDPRMERQPQPQLQPLSRAPAHAIGDGQGPERGNGVLGHIRGFTGQPTSKMNCFANDKDDKFCVLHRAQLSLSGMKTVPPDPQKGQKQNSREFRQNFISIDCASRPPAPPSVPGQQPNPYFPFPRLFSPTLASPTCDYVLPGTVLMYSHDHIPNLGHTMQDIFNVWLMTWLSGSGSRGMRNITFLNVDALRQYNNFDDEVRSCLPAVRS